MEITKGGKMRPFIFADLLHLFGLEVCSECRSWIWRTPLARLFHSRRCGT